VLDVTSVLELATFLTGVLEDEDFELTISQSNQKVNLNTSNHYRLYNITTTTTTTTILIYNISTNVFLFCAMFTLQYRKS